VYTASKAESAFERGAVDVGEGDELEAGPRFGRRRA